MRINRFYAFIAKKVNHTVKPLAQIISIFLFEQNFEKGTTSVFNIGVSNKIGSILRLRVWHDSGGGQPSWHLDKIVIKDTKTCNKYN